MAPPDRGGRGSLLRSGGGGPLVQSVMARRFATQSAQVRRWLKRGRLSGYPHPYSGQPSSPLPAARRPTSADLGGSLSGRRAHREQSSIRVAASFPTSV